jgi:hypothetical protein
MRFGFVPRLARPVILVKIFVYVFALLLSSETLEAMAGVAPYASKNTSASHAAIICVHDCASKIRLTSNWPLAIDSDAACIGKHD